MRLGYDPRARYLTGLGSPGPAKITALHVPPAYAALAARPMPQMSRRKRLALYGYDPRRRYLAALGQDEGDTGPQNFDWSTAGAINTGSAPLPSTPADIYPLAPAPAEVAYTSPTASVLPATGAIAVPSPTGSSAIVLPAAGLPASANPSSVSASASWLSTPSSVFGGVSNGLVLLGLGGVALLALFSSRRR